MTQPVQYVVKDPQGNMYGPAPMSTLRTWAKEGRIIGTMLMALEGSNDWRPASTYPEMVDALGPTPATPLATGQQNQGAYSASAGQNPFAQMPQTVGYSSPAMGLQTSKLALGAMWSSIGGIVLSLCPCFIIGSLPASIVGICLGFVALSKIRAEPDRLRGGTQAKAGIILGFVAIFLSIAVFVVFAIIGNKD